MYVLVFVSHHKIHEYNHFCIDNSILLWWCFFFHNVLLSQNVTNVSKLLQENIQQLCTFISKIKYRSFSNIEPWFYICRLVFHLEGGGIYQNDARRFRFSCSFWRPLLSLLTPVKSAAWFRTTPVIPKFLLILTPILRLFSAWLTPGRRLFYAWFPPGKRRRNSLFLTPGFRLKTRRRFSYRDNEKKPLCSVCDFCTIP